MRRSHRAYWLCVLPALGVLLLARPAVAAVTEGFESVAIGDFTAAQGGAGGPLVAAITPDAAHDGIYGLRFGGDNDQWLWRDYADAVAPGQTVDAFARFNGDVSGRIYVGIGATGSGVLSMVLGGNSNELILQHNDGYSDYTELAATPFQFSPDVWYRMEMVYGDGTATVNLYNDTASTVLASVTSSSTGHNATGGLAYRGFGYYAGATTDIDTVSRIGASVPEPGSLAMLGGLAISASTFVLRRRRRA